MIAESTRRIIENHPSVTVLLPDDNPGHAKEFDISAVRSVFGRLKFKVNTALLSEWSDGNRTQPAGSPFPGKWRNLRTPYMIEPMDNLAPSSPVETTVVMKPVQAGATACAAENKIAYSVDVDPCNILYVTATDDLGKEFGLKRLNPLLELCGLRDKLHDPYGSKSSKATGDKVTSKIFDGGNILICSYNQAALLRMSSFQVVIFDEVDTAPPNVNNEGDPLKIAEARTTAFEGRKVILVISTPITAGISPIAKAYEKYDKRRFYIRCPHCHKMILPELLDENDKCNLVYEFLDEGKSRVDEDSVYLPCPECDGQIKNYHKTKIYQNYYNGWCEWRPSVKGADPRHRSYHFDALLCPPGMISFESLAKEDAASIDDPEARQAFINLRGARPYQEQGEQPTADDVAAKVAGYERGTLPERMPLVTAGCDLHKDRLDVEIVGFNGNEVFSIEWMHFFGQPKYVRGGSLWKFAQAFRDGSLPGKPRLAFIDSRYEPDEVAACAMNNEEIFAVNGVEWLPNRAPFRETMLAQYDNMESVSINTGLLKWRTMNSLKRKKLSNGDYPPGYVHFPRDYEDAFYGQLRNEIKTAEYDKKTGEIRAYKWIPQKKNNSHALDCHVYALAAEEYEVYRLGQILEEEGIPIEEGYRETVWKILNDPNAINDIADAINN